MSDNQFQSKFGPMPGMPTKSTERSIMPSLAEVEKPNANDDNYPKIKKGDGKEVKYFGGKVNADWLMKVKQYALSKKSNLLDLIITAVDEYMKNHPVTQN